MRRRTREEVRDELYRGISPQCRRMMINAERIYGEAIPVRAYHIGSIYLSGRPRTGGEDALGQYISEMAKGGKLEMQHLSECRYQRFKDRMFKRQQQQRMLVVKQIIDLRKTDIGDIRRSHGPHSGSNLSGLNAEQRATWAQAIVDEYEWETNGAGFNKRILQRERLGLGTRPRTAAESPQQVAPQYAREAGSDAVEGTTTNQHEESTLKTQIRAIYDGVV